MIGPDHVRLMARYNAWQNRSLYAAASTLTDAQRRAEQGAFWGSIFGTLNHILWGDMLWLSRFAPGSPKPLVGSKDSSRLHPDWDSLTAARLVVDDSLSAFAATISEAQLAANLTWFSGAAGREVEKPVWLLVTHLFNHQTHHRGQVHCLLTQAGAKPDDTDLFLMPDA